MPRCLLNTSGRARCRFGARSRVVLPLDDETNRLVRSRFFREKGESRNQGYVCVDTLDAAAQVLLYGGS